MATADFQEALREALMANASSQVLSDICTTRPVDADDHEWLIDKLGMALKQRQADAIRVLGGCAAIVGTRVDQQQTTKFGARLHEIGSRVPVVRRRIQLGRAFNSAYFTAFSLASLGEPDADAFLAQSEAMVPGGFAQAVRSLREAIRAESRRDYEFAAMRYSDAAAHLPAVGAVCRRVASRCAAEAAALSRRT